ncbi:MAG: efflux RND transporter periplasmic adaptor subunit [Planctomycetota bacterium]
MAVRQLAWRQWIRWLGQAAIALGFAAGVVAALLYLAGKFSPKVSADVVPAAAAADEGIPVEARLKSFPRGETAVGTIRAVHETTIGSKLLARVLEVNLKAGQQVRQGDVLLRLDDVDLRAKLEQAKAAYRSAEAVHAQAVNDEARYAQLLRTNAVSRQQYEQAATALRSSEAGLRGAEEAVKEAQAMLDWATIRAPIDGVVIDKRVDAGDMVTPGQVLVTIFDPKQMQLVASVRESLAHRLAVGQEIDVHIDGLNRGCSGTISEIVPEAQAASRTFEVKVTGPCPGGVYTGMFGRLLIPLDEEQVLVIPRAAVRQVGQLELVTVLDNGRPVRRAIRTGRDFDGDAEVLSGLRAGEQVLVPSSDAHKEVTHG